MAAGGGNPPAQANSIRRQYVSARLRLAFQELQLAENTVDEVCRKSSTLKEACLGIPSAAITRLFLREAFGARGFRKFDPSFRQTGEFSINQLIIETSLIEILADVNGTISFADTTAHVHLDEALIGLQALFLKIAQHLLYGIFSVTLAYEFAAKLMCGVLAGGEHP